MCEVIVLPLKPACWVWCSFATFGGSCTPAEKDAYNFRGCVTESRTSMHFTKRWTLLNCHQEYKWGWWLYPQLYMRVVLVRRWKICTDKKKRINESNLKSTVNNLVCNAVKPWISHTYSPVCSVNKHAALHGAYIRTLSSNVCVLCYE